MAKTSKEKKKIKIPKSVEELRLSPKKFAKKHGIRIKGKGLSKGEKKRNMKRLRDEYAKTAITGLDKAVKIISENDPENKKVLKVIDGVDNIILNPKVMKRIAKLYKKNPDQYGNMMFLPHFILNTLTRYSQEGISEEDQKLGEMLDKEALIIFCEKILKPQIKRYQKLGISDEDMAFHIASTIPTTKVLKSSSRKWHKRLIQSLFQIAENQAVDLDVILPAIYKIDKGGKGIDKKDFYEGFYSEFILTRSSNKNHSFNDNQKELHESLIERTLEYLDKQKSRKTKEILKTYIKRRKTAESYKNDNKRVIKFVDHATSNSAYTNLKAVVQELIADNSANEAYLS